MPKSIRNNFAFIDSNNLNLGIKDLGWKIDYKKFRVYLKEKYNVITAYLFLGYIPGNEAMYTSLQKAGFVIIFKPVILKKDGQHKGNVDAELVMHTMIEYPNFEKAIIVSSDGDFHCLVRYLLEQNKLKVVMSPYLRTCSILLKKSAQDKIVFFDNLRQKLEYKRKSTA